MLSRIAVALITVAMMGTLQAHPGHGDVKRLSGRVMHMSDTTINVDAFDAATMQRKTISLTIDAKTKWVVGKKAGERFSLPSGHQVGLLMVMEDMPDGTMRTRAVEITVRKLPATHLARI